ncbi:MAG: UpxY family transcription antiterminator [Acidobacteriota bacterium]|nr:UpxY family transcription antiterminator [Acidobacteriota bacterium]
MQKIEHASLPNVSTSLPQGSSEASTVTRWYAVYTTNRHEKRVALHFSQRAIEHYLPLYRAERKWRNGLRVTLDLPLFPCYIFARIPLSERVRVLSVPGALTVVGGTGRDPVPLPDTDIDALRWGLKEQLIEPHPRLTAGQQVRILCGAFAGMEGVVLRKKGACRVVITLKQIMQSIAVEVDESNLELRGEGRGAAGRISGLGSGICLQGA